MFVLTVQTRPLPFPFTLPIGVCDVIIIIITTRIFRVTPRWIIITFSRYYHYYTIVYYMFRDRGQLVLNTPSHPVHRPSACKTVNVHRSRWGRYFFRSHVKQMHRKKRDEKSGVEHHYQRLNYIQTNYIF